jgi:broad specificity phosphatase PhoE
MSRLVFFITHPNVVISRDLPVPQWPLSERGLWRMHESLRQPWVGGISAIYCSREQKAIDGAQVLAAHLSLTAQQMHELGENDRSSTGFLPPAEFEEVANQFFARPRESVLGWEPAVNAQRPICGAVDSIVSADRTAGSIAIVSHGAVGTLLFCHLSGFEISRKWDQPANGGGNYFSFTAETRRVLHGWTPIDGIGPTHPLDGSSHL